MPIHAVRWWVHAWDAQGNSEMMPRKASMRGEWAYDAVCSCGWETKVGGGTQRYISELIRWHKAEVSE